MNRTLARAILARPLALALGGVAAALVNPSLRPGAMLEWMIAIFAGAALLVAIGARLPRLARGASFASPLVGLFGWGAFATFTGGLESPFIAAFILEIVVAVVSMGPRGVAWVTGWVLVVMGLIEVLYGFSEIWLLAVESVFVVAIGALGAGMARRREADEFELRVQGEELGQRLESLQRELEDERVISRVGENVARLAHGLKNAVHSLRGFVGLIEPRLERGAGTTAAMAGLHAAIDDLERLARLTLAEGASAESTAQTSGQAAAPVGGARQERGASVREAIEGARGELVAASPEVTWDVVATSGAESLEVAIEAEPLLELLVILMRNAVEAMKGKGNAVVEYGANGDFGVVAVSDEGPGFAPGDREKIFQPGFTTKAAGSGFGLFLARRIIEDHGGALALESADGGGARVRVELPAVMPPARNGAPA